MHALIIELFEGSVCNMDYALCSAFSDALCQVLECICQCHCVHLCNTDQSLRLDSSHVTRVVRCTWFSFIITASVLSTFIVHSDLIIQYMSVFSSLVQLSHVQIPQDLPMDWPKSDMTQPTETKTKAPKSKAKGKAKATAAAKTEPSTDSQKTRGVANRQSTPPAFLTNLVRCGNQMANSTSWNMVIGALESLVKQRLVVLPASDMSREQRLHRETQNITTLTLLGKWLPPKPDEKKSHLMESAEDLIACLGRNSV